jgi:ADP-heptose:LPS heptosyltransferase
MLSPQITHRLGDTLHLYAAWRHTNPRQPFTVFHPFAFLFPEVAPGDQTRWQPAEGFTGIHSDVHVRDAIADTWQVDRSLLIGPLWERPRVEDYVALCPHASSVDREWHPGLWKQLKERLEAADIPYRWLPAKGRERKALDLPELAEVLSKAMLVVGVDSGPGHLADAFGVPVIGLYGTTSAVVYGAYNSRHLAIDRHRHTWPGHLPYDSSRYHPHFRQAMYAIRVDEVMARIRQALNL